MNKEFVKSFSATAAITKRRLVKVGSTDGSVAVAAAATDNIIGVADSLGQATAGDMCDVVLAGIGEVEYGGTVTRGDRLVADSSGRAVAESAAGGSNVGVVGTALTSGVIGDIGEFLIGHGSMQG